MGMERAHAQLLGQLAFGARERGWAVWVGRSYRDALERSCRPCPRFIDDADLNHRCPGLPGQLSHVGMLWLDDSRVVCRVEAISAGRPSSPFPGPDRIRCLVVVDRPEDANALRRAGWATVLSRDLARYFRRIAIPQPLSRPARETQVTVVSIEPRGTDAYRLTLASDFIAATRAVPSPGMCKPRRAPGVRAREECAARWCGGRDRGPQASAAAQAIWRTPSFRP